jgi:hypothetical protein
MFFLSPSPKEKGWDEAYIELALTLVHKKAPINRGLLKQKQNNKPLI